ncbi:MAG: hypothetical protein COV74_01410 [Candidatus Omnitrophica bacterium CG11_big_fil_rev_8_21_14_0_20_45_26]|uniref:Uncharacterized protein n=1 Tax=Candidatus Abzuiibacterium crystallinum TaxID=1974748 RepID=A0A2H0LS83_9BACT|nr:MAG: hypothetical protein COV74_01410 [Candidatus Omnitrophica bacterium CG11_big_fil_rev_8_21_14_0_20_45_26]PIW64956.1 MAG: hypothetical protein COW12_03690 [Candidatus Omnitrophica bacterium CG12_big_fil_rev_8_21_14_0_65_45_16]
MQKKPLKKEISVVRRLTASLLAVALVLPPEALWAAPLAGIEIGAPVNQEARYQDLVSQIAIPQELGTIQERYASKSMSPAQASPIVVHIQDAHANYEAQRNIEQLMRYLNQTYGFSVVLLEGGAERLKPEQLQIFKDPKQNEKMIDQLMREGAATGSEAFLVSNQYTRSDVEAYGLESVSAYRADLEQFRKIWDQTEQGRQFARFLAQAIDRISSRDAHKELRDFIRVWQRFKESKNQLNVFLDALEKTALEALNIDLHDPRQQIDWPMLVRIAKLKEIQSGLRLDEAKKEWEQAKSQLEQAQVDERLIIKAEDRLFGKEAPMTDNIESTRSLFEEILVNAYPEGFTFKDYPQLAIWVGGTLLRHEIDGSELFDEAERLSARMMDVLAATESEKTIVTLYRDSYLLSDLFSLEMTREAFLDVQDNLNRFTPDRLIERIRLIDPNGTYPGEDALKPIMDLFSECLKSYEFAIKREEGFLNNIENMIRETKQDRVMTVAGGFHTKGMSDGLRRHHISYLIVSPRITQFQDVEKEHQNYITSLLQITPGMRQSTRTSPGNLVDDAIYTQLGGHSNWKNRGVAQAANGVLTAGSIETLQAQLRGGVFVELAEGSRVAWQFPGAEEEVLTTPGTEAPVVVRQILSTPEGIKVGNVSTGEFTVNAAGQINTDLSTIPVSSARSEFREPAVSSRVRELTALSSAAARLSLVTLSLEIALGLAPVRSELRARSSSAVVVEAEELIESEDVPPVDILSVIKYELLRLWRSGPRNDSVVNIDKEGNILGMHRLQDIAISWEPLFAGVSTGSGQSAAWGAYSLLNAILHGDKPPTTIRALVTLIEKVEEAKRIPSAQLPVKYANARQELLMVLRIVNNDPRLKIDALDLKDFFERYDVTEITLLNSIQGVLRAIEHQRYSRAQQAFRILYANLEEKLGQAGLLTTDSARSKTLSRTQAFQFATALKKTQSHLDSVEQRRPELRKANSVEIVARNTLNISQLSEARPEFRLQAERELAGATGDVFALGLGTRELVARLAEFVPTAFAAAEVIQPGQFNQILAQISAIFRKQSAVEGRNIEVLGADQLNVQAFELALQSAAVNSKLELVYMVRGVQEGALEVFEASLKDRLKAIRSSLGLSEGKAGQIQVTAAPSDERALAAFITREFLPKKSDSLNEHVAVVSPSHSLLERIQHLGTAKIFNNVTGLDETQALRVKVNEIVLGEQEVSFFDIVSGLALIESILEQVRDATRRIATAA